MIPCPARLTECIYIDVVNLSYPDLSFLAYQVARDLFTTHRDYVTNICSRYNAIRAGRAKDSLPMLLLSYVIDTSTGLKRISIFEGSNNQALCPFANNRYLHEEWSKTVRQSLTVNAVPVVVIVPRGMAPRHRQLMTALLLAPGSGSELESSRRVGDLSVQCGIRWLHCR